MNAIVAHFANRLLTWRNYHAEAQSRPHPLEGTRPRPIRVDGRGALIERFFLPLTLATPQNRTRGARQPWMGKKHRDSVLEAMKLQDRLPMTWRELPLNGRPLVRCIRYSSTEPDATSSWSKVPVDCLQPGGVRKVTRKVQHPRGHMCNVTREQRYDGLGIISSDRPSECDVVEWWEPAKRGEGFCVIEVFAG